MTRHSIAWFTREEVTKIVGELSPAARKVFTDAIDRAEKARVFGVFDGPPADVIPLRPVNGGAA